MRGGCGFGLLGVAFWVPRRGSVPMISPTPDPLKRLERQARRRAWLAPAVLAVLLAAFVIVMTVLQPPAPDQYVSYALNIGSLFVLLLAFGLLMRYLAGRGIRRFAPLKVRTKEADLALRGPSLALDNGLLVSFFAGGAFFTLFLGADGSVLHPRLAEALRWTRRRTKFARMVQSRRGKPSDSTDLEALLDRLGIGYAIAAVGEARASVEQAGGPRWVVSLNVPRLPRGYALDLLALHLDEAKVFMEGFARPSMAGATPQAFPWWRVAVGTAAMAGLAILLVAAFLWPDFALVFLTAGMVFIVVVAAFGAHSMRARPPVA